MKLAICTYIRPRGRRTRWIEPPQWDINNVSSYFCFAWFDSLGAVHDGSPPPSYLGGPGAEKCRWEDGYIMSDLRHTERGFRWSPCSVQSFHHFLKYVLGMILRKKSSITTSKYCFVFPLPSGDTASCLHNPPHEDEALGRALPGTLLSLDAQCRRDRGTSAYLTTSYFFPFFISYLSCLTVLLLIFCASFLLTPILNWLVFWLRRLDVRCFQFYFMSTSMPQ